MIKKVDFLIIGQGLAGTMLAFEMLDAGVDFRIVSAPGKSKASLVVAGMINPLVFKRLTKSWMVDTLLPVMTEKYRMLEKTLNKSFLYRKEILKPLSEQEKELWGERKKQPGFSNYIGDIRETVPIDYLSESKAYANVKQAGYLNLDVFLQAAEVYFRNKDLLVEDDFLLDEKQGDSTSYKIGDLIYEKLVFCEGYHLYKNSLFDFVQFKPVKGEVLQIYAPELSEHFILNKKVFVLPVGNHRFKVGSTYEWKDLSEKTTEDGRRSIIERLNQFVFADYKIENHWAGVRPTVADRRPVLGRHPKYKDIFVFNGLGTKGVMLAPYMAQEMVRFLNRENYGLSDEINVQRFNKK
uniref:NAD(P)/FAD-dependent oxidoreductase n=1 Tax=uncultured Draconibacterium sp. TaxID=1573823 RepID=UPI003217119B